MQMEKVWCYSIIVVFALLPGFRNLRSFVENKWDKKSLNDIRRRTREKFQECDDKSWTTFWYFRSFESKNPLSNSSHSAQFCLPEKLAMFHWPFIILGLWLARTEGVCTFLCAPQADFRSLSVSHWPISPTLPSSILFVNFFVLLDSFNIRSCTPTNHPHSNKTSKIWRPSFLHLSASFPLVSSRSLLFSSLPWGWPKSPLSSPLQRSLTGRRRRQAVSSWLLLSWFCSRRVKKVCWQEKQEKYVH